MAVVTDRCMEAGATTSGPGSTSFSFRLHFHFISFPCREYIGLKLSDSSGNSFASAVR